MEKVYIYLRPLFITCFPFKWSVAPSDYFEGVFCLLEKDLLYLWYNFKWKQKWKRNLYQKTDKLQINHKPN